MCDATKWTVSTSSPSCELWKVTDWFHDKYILFEHSFRSSNARMNMRLSWLMDHWNKWISMRKWELFSSFTPSPVARHNNFIAGDVLFTLSEFYAPHFIIIMNGHGHGQTRMLMPCSQPNNLFYRFTFAENDSTCIHKFTSLVAQRWPIKFNWIADLFTLKIKFSL